MRDSENDENLSGQEDSEELKEAEEFEEIPVDKKERLTAEIKAANEKYLRLYAEFENYKKRVQKDKEELLKYANEKIIQELLPVIDNLESALEHSKNNATEGIVQGVENTLKELLRVLRKCGLNPIEAMGRDFDPSIHHALSVEEREDMEENKVTEVFRKGYMFRDKVIRAPLVGVSKKPAEVKEGKKIKIIEEES
jgi:molecular chaperone GrpE